MYCKKKFSERLYNQMNQKECLYNEPTGKLSMGFFILRSKILLFLDTVLRKFVIIIIIIRAQKIGPKAFSS